MKWLARLLTRTTPEKPPRPEPVVNRQRDEAARAYQSDKLAAVEKQIELIARMRRLGYDVDVAARRISADGE